MNLSLVNDVCLRNFGIPVVFTVDAAQVQVTGILRQQAASAPVGHAQVRRPAAELVVKTIDLDGTGVGINTPLKANGDAYEVVSRETGLHGMTLLTLKRGA